jgi:hypothetical protein
VFGDGRFDIGVLEYIAGYLRDATRSMTLRYPAQCLHVFGNIVDMSVPFTTL